MINKNSTVETDMIKALCDCSEKEVDDVIAD